GHVNLAQLRIAAARHVLGFASTEELQRAADGLLDQGLYTYSLGELATRPGLILSDAGPLLKAAFRELGIPEPTKEDAIRTMLDHHIRAIVEASRPIYTTLDSLYYELYMPMTGQDRHFGQSHGIDGLISAFYLYDDFEDRADEVTFEGERGPEGVVDRD